MIKAKLLKFNVENLNNRIYTRQEVCPHLDRLNERAKTQGVFGQIGYPENFEISLNHASHKIHKFYVEGDFLMADIEILATREGDMLRDLMAISKEGMVFRTRSAGVTDEDTNVVKLTEIFTADAIEASTDAFKGLMD